MTVEAGDGIRAEGARVRISPRLKDGRRDELEALEDRLRSEHALHRVVAEREHAPTAPGDVGVLAGSPGFAVDAGLVGVLAQPLVDRLR